MPSTFEGPWLSILAQDSIEDQDQKQDKILKFFTPPTPPTPKKGKVQNLCFCYICQYVIYWSVYELDLTIYS